MSKERRDVYMKVRFRPSERQVVKLAAEATKRTDSDYIRVAAIRAAETDLAESAA